MKLKCRYSLAHIASLVAAGCTAGRLPAVLYFLLVAIMLMLAEVISETPPS